MHIPNIFGNIGFSLKIEKIQIACINEQYWEELLGHLPNTRIMNFCPAHSLVHLKLKIRYEFWMRKKMYFHKIYSVFHTKCKRLIQNFYQIQIIQLCRRWPSKFQCPLLLPKIKYDFVPIFGMSIDQCVECQFSIYYEKTFFLCLCVNLHIRFDFC